MANFKPLIDGFESAIAPITPALLGTALPRMEFTTSDAVVAPPGGFSAVYAFGDSLSDAGNASIATAGLVPVSPPYSDGHFTNGNVWVQDLSQDLGLPPVKASLAGGTDYAYGGAETGTTPVHTANPTDLPSQLGQFVASQPHPDPNALYTVWAGSNDVLDIANNTTLTPAQQAADVEAAVNNEAGFIAGLAAHGAKNVVVMNVPDLGKTPYEMARPDVDANASALSARFNSELATAMQTLAASGALKVDLIDTYAVLDGVVANPAAYGFTNVTQPLWTGNLTSASSGTLQAAGAAQNGYLFFDPLHPTAQAHALLASGVAQSLSPTA
ncbi:MAG TPA: SGNH/GDSL hydrolase family protein [Acetobacteraceae bacterium]